VEINGENFHKYLNLTDGIVLLKKFIDYLGNNSQDDSGKSQLKTQLLKICDTL